MRMVHWWNYTDRENRSAWHETCPRATLHHMEKITTWIGWYKTFQNELRKIFYA